MTYTGKFSPKPTIYDIKYCVGGYFFSRDSMKFFGQTMKDFKVKTNKDKSRCFIYAPAYMRQDDGKWRFAGFYSFREFTGSDLKNVPDVDTHSLQSILDYIEQA